MARSLLHAAADEVAATSRELPDADTSERLSRLAQRLRRQADREATPALGALDRIQLALEEIAADIDEEPLADRLENAREEIFSFLETLEDRGMTQHGWSRDTGSNGRH